MVDPFKKAYVLQCYTCYNKNESALQVSVGPIFCNKCLECCAEILQFASQTTCFPLC